MPVVSVGFSKDLVAGMSLTTRPTAADLFLTGKFNESADQEKGNSERHPPPVLFRESFAVLQFNNS